MNRAHRLAAWLEKFSKTDKKNTNLGQLVAKELGTETGSPDYYIALAQLKAQFHELKDTFLTNVQGDRQKAIFARCLKALEKYFDPIYVSNVAASELISRQDDIDHLFVISEQMDQDERVTESAVIDSIIKQAQDLQSTLMTLDIDRLIRLHLARLLDTFIMAARGHDTFGIEGLSTVFGSLASEIARAAGTVKVAGADAKTWTTNVTDFLKRVGAAVVWTGSVAKGGSDAIEAGEAVAGLLTQG